MNRGAWTSLGAVGAAILASSCCLGPLILALLGAGTIGASGMLERFRPFMVVVALAMLGTALFLTYRRRPVACNDGSCESSRASHWSRLGMWVVTLIVLGILMFPNWSQDFFSAGTHSRLDSSALRFSVSGMTCAGCALTIQKALSEVPGVKGVEVDLESATAKVEVATNSPPQHPS